MKLKTIEAVNLKGYSFVEVLAPVTIITGPNGSGKTARLDALRLAILGNVPQGKTPKAIYAYASGPSLTAGVSFDAGGAFSRTWKPKGKSITSSTSGELPEGLDPVMIDGALFLAAKPAARAAMLRERFPSATDPKTELLAAIREALGTGREVPAVAEAEDLAEWLESMGDALAAQASAQRELATRLKKTVQGIETARLGDDVAHDLQQRAAALPTLSSAATAAAAAAGAAKSNSDRLENVARELEEELADHRSQHTPGEPILGTVPDLKRELAQNEAELSDVTARLTRAQQQEQALATAQAELTTAQQRVNAALELGATDDYLEPGDPVDIVTISRRVADLERVEGIKRSDHETAVRALETLRSNAEHVQTCPHCGADAAHFGADYLQRQGKAIQEAQDKVNRAADAYNEAGAAAHAGRAQLDEASKAHNAREALVTHREKCRSLAAGRADVARLTAAIQQLGGVPAGGESLVDQKSNLEDIVQEIKTQIAELEAVEALDALAARVRDARDAADIAGQEAVRTEQFSTDANVRQQNAQYAAQQWATQQGEEARIVQVTAEAVAADEATKAYEAAQKLLKAEGLKIAGAALAPVVEAANALCGAILPTPMAAFGIELGRWKGATWVPLDLFSGAEKAMAVCAIQVALAAGSKMRLAVLDEFSRLDNGRKGKFAQQVIHLVEAGTLDQAIILDCRDMQTTNPLVKVVRLTEAAA